MATLRIASKANQAASLPALLVVTHCNDTNPNAKIDIHVEEADALDEDGTTVKLDLGSNGHLRGSEEIIGYLLQKYPVLSDGSEKEVREWIHRSSAFVPPDFKTIEGPLLELDAHLTLRSHVVGYTLSAADLSVFGSLRGNNASGTTIRKGAMVNLSRWYRFIDESNPWIVTAVQSLNAVAEEKKMAKSKKGGSYDIALKDTEKGVVTRFPPEPSGYLHIGHAKAALLNDYFAHEAYKGKLICRFDDTNPSKEKEEYQDAIVEDLALMGIKPDVTSYSSDYFEAMYEFCVKLLQNGKAYADDTEMLQMKEERTEGIKSKRRDEAIADNLARFQLMKEGTEAGLKWCIRAKISIDDPNKSMRDPVLYRCNLTPHHRTGTRWKIYPTYGLCVATVDSLEGVTHALRTNEYRDQNAQYEWIQRTLGLRKVHIWDFARMNFIRTLLSKRKLTKFVDDGVVWGWDDPRFPTIRGIRRRGMTIEALREFILRQGPSRNVVNLDWTIFWATNKKHIDPVAPRHTAVTTAHAVTATVRGARATPYTEAKPKHGKNPDLGTKTVAYSDTILLDQDDAQSFAQDEEITLMSWGNAIVRKITHSLNPLHPKLVTGLELDLNLQGDVKTTDKKITWLATRGPELVPVRMIDFDFLITKDKIEEDEDVADFLNPRTIFETDGLADANVAALQAGDIIQFERKGYFRLDKPFQHGEPAVFFAIPTGKGGK